MIPRIIALLPPSTSPATTPIQLQYEAEAAPTVSERNSIYVPSRARRLAGVSVLPENAAQILLVPSGGDFPAVVSRNISLLY